MVTSRVCLPSCRSPEQCCSQEAGPGGLVPWIRSTQGAGVVLKLHRLPGQEAPHPIWPDQEDEH